MSAPRLKLSFWQLDARTSRAFALVGGSFIARFASVAVALVTLPLAYSYLGAEQFGVWMTITSFTALLGFADFGLGNGVINLVSAANARAEGDELKRIVATAYTCLIALAIVVGFLSTVIWHVGNPSEVFSVSTAASVEARAALAAFAGLFIVNLPLNLVNHIQLGLQRGHLNGLSQLLAACIALITIPAAIHYEASLAVLVFCLSGSQIAGNVINSMLCFRSLRQRPGPWAGFDWQTATTIIKTGFLFFVLQIAVSLAVQSDTLVINTVLGATAAGEYAIVQKVFTVISVIAGIVMGAFWPAYADAMARREYTWVITTFKKTLLVGAVGAAIASAGVFLFFSDITKIWLGREFAPPSGLVGAFAIWSVVSVVGASIGSMLNGTNVFRFQVLSASVVGVSAFALKLSFVDPFGPAGTVYATILAFLLISLPSQAAFLRRHIRELRLR